MDIPEAIQKVAEAIAGGLYKYAAAPAAVGLVSMAIIQTLKDTLPRETGRSLTCRSSR